MAERHDGSDTTAGGWRAAIVGSVTGLLGIGILQYRRRNRQAAARALHDAVEPPGVDEPLGVDAGESTDEAHAPGHRHLAPPPTARRPVLVRRAQRRADRSGHPARFG